MHDFPGFKRAAIRYWERRRIVYNLVVIPPAALSLVLVGGIEAGLGGVPIVSTNEIIWMFVISAVGANICYSFAYVLEFLIGNDATDSHWLRWGRTAAFICGIFASMVLSFYGGANIAMKEYGVHP